MRSTLITIITLVSTLVLSTTVFAAPISKGPFYYQQPDGATFRIQRIIDEYGTYDLTDEGYVVVLSKIDNYYYYGQCDSEGNFSPSFYKVGIEDSSAKKSLELLFEENARKLNTHIEKINSRNIPGIKKTAKTASFTFPSLPESLYIVLVEFYDEQGDPSFTKSDFESLFFEHNRSGYGSLRDYYYEMSDGDFDLDGSVANTGDIDWVEMPEDKNYYADSLKVNFTSNEEVIEAFLDSLKSQQGIEIDLSDESNKIAILYAGNVREKTRLHSRASSPEGYFIAASEKGGL